MGALLVAQGPLFAQEVSEVRIRDPLSVAAQLYRSKRYQEAIVLVEALKRADGFENYQKASDAILLLARALSKIGKNARAIGLLRQLIETDKENAAAKIALAEIYISEGRESDADPLLRDSLLHQMPDSFRAQIEQYISARKTVKPYKSRFGFSIIPDSNVNAATGSEEVEIFGLPFSLTENAQASSGVGMQGNVRVDYRLKRLGKNAFLSTSVDGRYTAYSNNEDFNEGLLSGQLSSTHALSAKTVVRAGARGLYRNFGGSTFSYGYGFEGMAQHSFNESQQLRVSLTGLRLENQFDRNRDSFYFAARTLLRQKISDSMGVEGYVAIERELSRGTSLTNSIFRIGLGLQKRFENGIGIYLNPEGYLRPFDEQLAVFPEPRKDHHLSITMAASNDNWKIGRFAPSIRVIYENNFSNLMLFRYERFRLFLEFNNSF